MIKVDLLTSLFLEVSDSHLAFMLSTEFSINYKLSQFFFFQTAGLASLS